MDRDRPAARGVQRVHILVALGYVASPVAEFLTFLTATEPMPRQCLGCLSHTS